MHLKIFHGECYGMVKLLSTLTFVLHYTQIYVMRNISGQLRWGGRIILKHCSSRLEEICWVDMKTRLFSSRALVAVR